MTELSPTALHNLIGTRCAWNESLWRQALDLVLTENNYVRMSMVRALVGMPWPRAQTSDKALVEFRRLPPTVMLGLYDRARWELTTDAYAVEDS